MAKIYGERWKTEGDAGEGGQANVFRVKDLSGALNGDFALKRLRSSARLDRFSAEVAAVERIDHPNVIKIVDHSPLAGDVPVNYIVMPFAQYGDLQKRHGLYKNNVDGTLQVVRSIAIALRAAHSKGVVHRDIKPANILFPAESNDVWVSDFGIALLADQERHTADGFVMGARGFTAPELEIGGPNIEISPAADVYSLGQVLFFMLSGQTFARENVFDNRYDIFFHAGERQRLVRALLSKMVSPVASRHPDMEPVLAALDQIVEWEASAQTLNVAPETLKAITAFRETHQRKAQAAAEAKLNRENNEKVRAAAIGSAKAWLLGECTKTVPIFGGAEFGFKVKELGSNFGFSLGERRGLYSIDGASIVREVGDQQRTTSLQFLICDDRTFKITFNVASSANHANVREGLQQAQETAMPLAILPVIEERHTSRKPDYYCLTDNGPRQLFMDGNLYSLLRPDNRPRSMMRINHSSYLADPSQGISISLILFDANEWLSHRDDLKNLFAQAVEIFVSHLSRT